MARAGLKNTFLTFGTDVGYSQTSDQPRRARSAERHETNLQRSPCQHMQLTRLSDILSNASVSGSSDPTERMSFESRASQAPGQMTPGAVHSGALQLFGGQAPGPSPPPLSSTAAQGPAPKRLACGPFSSAGPRPPGSVSRSMAYDAQPERHMTGTFASANSMVGPRQGPTRNPLPLQYREPPSCGNFDYEDDLLEQHMDREVGFLEQHVDHFERPSWSGSTGSSTSAPRLPGPVPAQPHLDPDNAASGHSGVPEAAKGNRRRRGRRPRSDYADQELNSQPQTSAASSQIDMLGAPSRASSNYPVGVALQPGPLSTPGASTQMPETQPAPSAPVQAPFQPPESPQLRQAWPREANPQSVSGSAPLDGIGQADEDAKDLSVEDGRSQASAHDALGPASNSDTFQDDEEAKRPNANGWPPQVDLYSILQEVRAEKQVSEKHLEVLQRVVPQALDVLRELRTSMGTPENERQKVGQSILRNHLGNTSWVHLD